MDKIDKNANMGLSIAIIERGITLLLRMVEHSVFFGILAGSGSQICTARLRALQAFRDK